MVQDTVIDIYAQYGLLGLGWVIVPLLYFRNIKLQDRLHNVAVETNKTLTILAERLR